MKATLEFNLPEEREEFDQATRAAALFVAVFEFDQSLRSRSKNGPEADTPADERDEIRAMLWDILSARGCEI